MTGPPPQGRPVGFLAAWLIAAKDFPSKQEHQEFKKRLGTFECFDARINARVLVEALAENDPALRAVLRRERDPTPEEAEHGGEPLDIPWRG